ncbi:MAG: hypothetical protein AB7P67_15650, partial [Vicinamibacterales bacterium]
MKRLVKPVVILALLALLGVLLVRSASSTRTEAYTISGTALEGWTLALDPDHGDTGTLLGLQAPDGFNHALFNQVFQRTMESFASPTVSFLPVVLRDEFDSALAGSMTPEQLLQEARTAGLEASPIQPVCMALKRDGKRQVYFVLFQAPAVAAFRRQLAARAAVVLDPARVPATLIVAAGASS